jgi:hypothetical protein
MKRARRLSEENGNRNGTLPVISSDRGNKTNLGDDLLSCECHCVTEAENGPCKESGPFTDTVVDNLAGDTLAGDIPGRHIRAVHTHQVRVVDTPVVVAGNNHHPGPEGVDIHPWEGPAVDSPVQ